MLTPRTMTIGGVTAANWVGGAFTFGGLFPLTGPATTFNYTITYGLYDATGRFLRDTTHAVTNYTVQIDPTRTLPPDSFEVRHWSRDLSFRYNGAAISAASAAMDSVELYFSWSPGDANYNYTNVKIQCMTTNGTPNDDETFTLVKGTGYYSLKIKRLLSAVPVPGNGVLEQAQNDIIVAVFRNSENPRLPLDTLRISIGSMVTPQATLTSATTRDIDGDGLLDRIDLVFDSVTAISPGSASRFQVSSGNIVFQVDSIIKTSDRTYSLVLREQATTAPQTGLRPTVQVQGFSSVDGGTVVAQDGAGPVAWRVIYAPSMPVGNATAYSDTLHVTLSEPVQCNTVTSGAVGASFRYYSGQNGYNAQALNNASFAVSCTQPFSSQFLIVVPTASFTITPGKDSLQLAGAVTDSSGNAPPLPDIARKARIEPGANSNNVVMTVGPTNPIIIRRNSSADQFPPNMRQFYREVIGGNNTGAVIAFNTKSSLEQKGDGTYGRLVIYDAVGNIVQDLPVKRAGTSKDYASLWDFKNRAGRYVGNGTYLAVATVRTTGASKDQTVKQKVGIRRE